MRFLNSFSNVKYTGIEWITLLDYPEESTIKVTYLLGVSIGDIFIKDNFLYLGVSNISGKGIGRFDISKNTLLTDDDFDFIQDPAFPSFRVEQFYLGNDGTLYVLNDNGEVAAINCF